MPESPWWMTVEKDSRDMYDARERMWSSIKHARDDERAFMQAMHNDNNVLRSRIHELEAQVALGVAVVDAVVAVKTHSEGVEKRLDRDNDWEFTDEEMEENNRLVGILDAALDVLKESNAD